VRLFDFEDEGGKGMDCRASLAVTRYQGRHCEESSTKQSISKALRRKSGMEGMDGMDRQKRMDWMDAGTAF
jgi:hypothetical protein